jgi:hypothetical protein
MATNIYQNLIPRLLRFAPGLALEVANFSRRAVVVFAPKASRVRRLLIVDMIFTAVLFIESLIGDVVTADAHVFAKPNFGLGMGGDNHSPR